MLPHAAIGFTLVITTILAPRTSIVNQVMLLFPCLWAVRASRLIPPGTRGYQVEHLLLSPVLPAVLRAALPALNWQKADGAGVGPGASR